MNDPQPTGSALTREAILRTSVKTQYLGEEPFEEGNV